MSSKIISSIRRQLFIWFLSSSLVRCQRIVMWDAFAVSLVHSVSLYIPTEEATVLASQLVSRQSSIIIPTMKFLVSRFILFKWLFILPLAVSNRPFQYIKILTWLWSRLKGIKQKKINYKCIFHLLLYFPIKASEPS